MEPVNPPHLTISALDNDAECTAYAEMFFPSPEWKDHFSKIAEECIDYNHGGIENGGCRVTRMHATSMSPRQPVLKTKAIKRIV